LDGAYNLPDEQKNYIKFYHNNFDYYCDIDNIADVAILHSFATMAHNNDLPYQSTFLFEQSLIQEKIPFDIIFDKQLENLSKYKVLVLADQECLSDEKLDAIKKFVNNGGGLVASEFTSLYTEWRERKHNFGLKDILSINAPEWKGKDYEEDFLKISVQKNLIGKGRVVYIPEITPSVPKPSGVAMTSNYWKLPLNNSELIESVEWASGNNLSVSIAAPQTITMELTQKKDKSASILHLVNFDYRDSSVQNIKVDIMVPEGKKVTHVSVLTPDGRDDEILQFKEIGKKVVFTVPKLSIYDMVVIKLE
jgi:hypothetical protein